MHGGAKRQLPCHLVLGWIALGSLSVCFHRNSHVRALQYTSLGSQNFVLSYFLNFSEYNRWNIALKSMFNVLDSEIVLERI